jgi:acyl carrier protein
VKILTADMAKRSEVAGMLAALSGMPPLKGIIHAAGVLADGVLVKQDVAQFRKVLAPKVEGAWNLHEATRELPLDFFVCYSSAAAVLGSAGQSNYAAANAFLDGLVHARRRQGLHGLSVSWGPWELGMAAGIDHRRIAAQGFKAIAPAQGFAILERLLLQDETHACVMPMNWDTYLRCHYRDAVPPLFETVSRVRVGRRSVTGEKSAIRRKLEEALAGERRTVLIDYVNMQVAAVLHLKSGKRVPAGLGLFDHGMDSLTAMELKNRFETDLGKSLRATLVFDYPTVEAIAGHLLEETGLAAEKRQASCKDNGHDTVAAASAVEIDAALADELTKLEALLKGN